MTPVIVSAGTSPVILAFPHVGTLVPGDIAANLNEEGLLLRDTDWHVDRLYESLLPGATTVRATFHRYVVDANRDPSGASLYPGQNTTGLVPLTDFDNRPIWKREPDAGEVARRRQAFHAPYHAALAAEMDRVRALHGVAVLYDCHSIRSVCPYLFDGVLPDFNVGTDNGATCHPSIERAVAETAANAASFRTVLNGRFRGGWTTRHYGRPETNVHAVQMELAQITHLETEAPPFAFDEVKAARLRKVLKDILERVEKAALALGGKR